MRCDCCASPTYRFDSLPDILAQTLGLAVDRTRQSGEATPPNVRTHMWTVESGFNAPC